MTDITKMAIAALLRLPPAVQTEIAIRLFTDILKMETDDITIKLAA